MVAWPFGNPGALAVSVAVPLEAKPCRKTVVVLRFAGIVDWTCCAPQTVVFVGLATPGHTPLVCTNNLEGSLLVKVTSIGVGLDAENRTGTPVSLEAITKAPLGPTGEHIWS